MDRTINSFPIQYYPSIAQDEDSASSSLFNNLPSLTGVEASDSKNSGKANRVTRPRPVQVHKPSTDQTLKAKGQTVTLDPRFDSETEEICSYCNIGRVEKNFNLPGVVLCLICFPVGFVWLFCFMEKQCSHCGKIYVENP